MESHNDTSAAAKGTHYTGVKLPLWVSLFLLGLVIAVIAWRQFSVVSAERLFERERQELTAKLNAEREAALARARQALAEHNERALELFGTALGWSVRGAVMRNNRDEIDQYFTDLVKHHRVRLALFADAEGNVVVSSDRNFLGSPFSQHFPAPLLKESSVTVHPGEGELKRIVVPIHGLSTQLGTVLVVYEAPSLASA